MTPMRTLFRDVMSLRDAMDRLFEESFVAPERIWATFAAGRTVPLEIYETGDAIVCRALVAGANPENLDIQVDRGVLTIKAKFEAPKVDDERTVWHLREIGYGEVTRTVTLPVEVDAEKAQANFEHGILTLTLPKVEAYKPKKIAIDVKPQLTAGATA